MKKEGALIILALGLLFLLQLQSPTGLFFAPQIDISSCVNITQSSNLTQNLTSSETCLNITASNLAVDCNGFSILFDTSETGESGIRAENQTNITLQNCVLVANSLAVQQNHVNLTNVSNSSLVNVTFQTRTDALWLAVNQSVNITLQNTTFQTDFGSIAFAQAVTLDSTVNISSQNINISQNRSFVNSSNLTYFNISAHLILENITSSPRIEFDANDDGSFDLCPASICMVLGYNGSTVTFNVTQFSVYQAVSYCPFTLNQSVNLTINLTANTSCFTIGSSNLTLDCQDHYIFYDANGVEGDAVNIVNQTNITLQRCHFEDLNGMNVGGGASINFTNTSNLFIINNTFQTNGTSAASAILGFGGSQNITITNNHIQTNGTVSSSNHGIFLNGARNVNITYNTIRTGHKGNANHPLHFVDVNYSHIAHNALNASGSGNNQRGIVLQPGRHAVIINNTVIGWADSGNSVGVLLNPGINVSIVGNYFLSNGSLDSHFGIFSFGITSNILIANNTIVTDGTGVGHRGITTVASNLTVINNNITTHGNSSYAIVQSGTNGTYIGNTLRTSGDSFAYALRIEGSSSVNFYNTTFDDTSLWIWNTGANVQSNYTNSTFKTPHGSIIVPQNFSVNGALQINRTELNVTYNRAFLNSTNLTFMNLSAIITLQDLLFSDPRPLVDTQDNDTYVTCTIPLCVEQSYINNAFSFTVLHFTSYSSEETPVVLQGGSTPQVNYAPAQPITVVSRTQTIMLALGQSASFSVENMQHTLTVTSMSQATLQATVRSSPREVTLSKDHAQSIDLTGDGTHDVRLTYFGIEQGKAVILLSILVQEVPAPLFEQPRASPVIAQDVEPVLAPIEEPELAMQTLAAQPVEQDYRILWYLFAIISLIAVVGLWLYTHHKHLKHYR